MKNSFPEILKELRLDKKLTLQQLAKETGISYTSLQQYEANTRTATYPVIIALAKYFGVTCGQILGTEEL